MLYHGCPLCFGTCKNIENTYLSFCNGSIWRTYPICSSVRICTLELEERSLIFTSTVEMNCARSFGMSVGSVQTRPLRKKTMSNCMEIIECMFEWLDIHVTLSLKLMMELLILDEDWGSCGSATVDGMQQIFEKNGEWQKIGTHGFILCSSDGGHPNNSQLCYGRKAVQRSSVPFFKNAGTLFRNKEFIGLLTHGMYLRKGVYINIFLI